MSEHADLVAWLRLAQLTGVGSGAARQLLSVCGLPQNIFASSYTALCKIVPERVVKAILAVPSAQIQARIDATMAWVAQPGHRVLTLADSDYPAALLSIADPPLLLHVKGRSELLQRPALAMIGSRHATAQGMQNATYFAKTFSQGGLTIISGLALGIDTAAHQGGLQGAHAQPEAGSTVAVIGTGVDLVYPARNRSLAHQIAEQGCIVSEYLLGMPGLASNFPRRNRIIAGLAQGVLVVEAAAQSGSLITARLAAESGREVFAIPGSIHSPLTKGCHQLIRQGAKLVETVQDVWEELGIPHAPETSVPQPAGLAQENQALLALLGEDPVSFDMLAACSGSAAATLHSHLLALELAGAIEILPGGMYRRIHRLPS